MVFECKNSLDLYLLESRLYIKKHKVMLSQLKKSSLNVYEFAADECCLL